MFRWSCFVCRFPKDKWKRQAWAAALRRRGFMPNDCSVVCSCHFKPQEEEAEKEEKNEERRWKKEERRQSRRRRMKRKREGGGGKMD